MISVAMTVYNGEPFLKEQLDSILNQTKPVDEIVIVDDGSTDGSLKILNEYKEKHSCIRLYLNETNLGYKRNFRKAISLCKGEIIFLSDQDDRWHPDKVAVMCGVLKDPEITVLASSFQFIDKDSRPYEVKPVRGRSNNNMYLKKVADGALVPVTFNEFLEHNYFQGCSLAIKRSAVKDFLEGFTDLLPHDWLISLMASYKKGMYFLNERLFDYRMHDHNTIGVPEKGKKTNELRLQTIKDTLAVNEAVRKLWPDYYASHPECEKMRIFCQEHYAAVVNNDVKTLLKENLDPTYRKLKGFRGRLTDLRRAFKGR